MKLSLKVDSICGPHTIGNFDKANTLLRTHDIVVISGELNYVTTKDGVRYNIEKYCYSKPANMVSESDDDNRICSMVSS